MAFYRFLLKHCRWALYFSVAVGLLSGFGLSGLMSVIHRALEGNPEYYFKLLLAFFVLWIVYGFACIFSEFLLIRMSEKVTFRVKLGLVDQIFRKELRALEEIGEDRLLTIIVEDVEAIKNLVARLPNAFINIAIVTGCYGYMLWLSAPLFLFNICFLFAAIALYKIPGSIAKRSLARVREVSDEVVKQFRYLTQGIKELLLHRRKRHEFLSNHLHANNDEFMKRSISAKSIYIISQRFGELLVLANIGCLLFILPRFYKVDAHVLTGFILACLFSLSPLTTLLSFIPQWIKVNVALEKVQGYGFDIFNPPPEEHGNVPIPEIPHMNTNQLKLENITFEYKDELNDDRFVVGPASFHLNSGELTFLVGGNGTGKTTLAKIICGLYPPMGGQIVWNGETINSSNREDFHQNFSVVFSDYFLFRHLIGISPEQIEDNAERYLKTLRLREKVSVRNGAFSTIDLSHGQRKRLALLAACLEDRPIYIFDEWAAGQDTSFKKVFYEEILMDLKKRNKMVLVITHDDNYFPIADRLIKIEDGKIVHVAAQL